MALTSMKYFIAVADNLSFSRAAERLFISQQALSKHVSQLEEEYGAPLFDRRPQVRLTYAGEIFYRYAKKTVLLQSEMSDELDDVIEQRKGKLVIGMGYARSRTWLPFILPDFFKEYPRTDFQLVADHATNLSQALTNHTIDLFLGYNCSPDETFARVVIGEDSLHMVIPQKFFPSDKTAEDFDGHPENFHLLKDTPFLLMPKGNQMRTVAEQLLKEQGISPSITFESLDNELLLSLAATGLGVTIAPKSLLTANRFSFEQAVVVPLPISAPWRDIVVLYCKDRYLSRAAKGFIELCKSALAQRP